MTDRERAEEIARRVGPPEKRSVIANAILEARAQEAERAGQWLASEELPGSMALRKRAADLRAQKSGGPR